MAVAQGMGSIGGCGHPESGGQVGQGQFGVPGGEGFGQGLAPGLHQQGQYIYGVDGGHHRAENAQSAQIGGCSGVCDQSVFYPPAARSTTQIFK